MPYSPELSVVIAILCGYLVQTVTGFAGGLIGLPILLTAFEIAPAVAILSLFNLIFSLIQVSRTRESIDFSMYKDLLLPTAVGVALGVTVLSYGQPVILKKCLGVFILTYLIYRLRTTQPLPSTRLINTCLGLVGGFFAGLFSSGAPPFVIYVISKFKEPKEIRANTIGILAVTNVLRPTLLVFTGVLGMGEVKSALVGIPSFLFALLLGERLFRRLSKQLFLRIVMLFLFVSAVMLLFK